ncbi:glycosyltransferase, partial [Peribacillus sp. NPDC060186]
KTNSEYLRDEYGIQDDEKVIIHVSNFRSVKRVKDVIQAFFLAQKKIPAKLLLVGDGPEVTTVLKLAKDLGIDEKVLFLGKQDNLAELYSISDLILLLSEKESFGLVLLEAMACGIPCIGTNVGGIPEVIVDGKTGYICELGDVQMVAEKAVGLLSNPILHKRFSEAALERANTEFHSDTIMSEYEAIYVQALETNSIE